MSWWLFAGAMAVVTALLLWWRGTNRSTMPGQRPRATTDQRQSLSTLVLDAYGADWAERFGVSVDALRDSVLQACNAQLAHRIDKQVGVVDVCFEEARDARGLVRATVTYAGTDKRATAQVELPWDDVPGDVRAEFIRKTGGPVFRKWRAAVDA